MIEAETEDASEERAVKHGVHFIRCKKLHDQEYESALRLPCHDLYSSVLSHICICFNCFLCVSNVDLLFAAWSLQTVFAAENEGDNPIEWLKNSIPGEPDVDYPILASTQQTAFSCDGLIFGGYYADPETRCQQYHVCLQVGFTRNLVSAIIAVPLCAMKTCSNFSGSY